MRPTIYSLPLIKASMIRLELVRHGGERTRVEVRRFSPEDDIWGKADEIISGWRAKAPVHDEYFDRVEFVVFFENGATFVSLLVLQFDDDAEGPPATNEPPRRLADETRHCALVFSGHRRPSALTTPQYLDVLRHYGRASREFYENLLKFYEIPEGEDPTVFAPHGAAAQRAETAGGPASTESRPS
jgi:hypothetical protein